MAENKSNRDAHISSSLPMERVYVTEKKISVFRILVLISCATHYLYFSNLPRSIPWLADSLLVVISIYCFILLFLEPYRNIRLLRLLYFVTVTDACLIFIWIYATGGIESPYFIIAYTAITSIAIRHNLAVALATATLYSLAYLAAALMWDMALADFDTYILRASFIFLAGGISSILSNEISLQVAVLNATNLQLEREIQTRLEAERELALRDQRKDEFIGMLSHELRNPLAAISAGMDVLEPNLGRIPEYRVPFFAVQRQVKKIRSMTNDLLDVSRMTKGKLVLNKETTAWHDLMSSAFATVESVVKGNGQQLEIVLPDDQIMVDVDPLRAEQMVTNLIENAAKFSPMNSKIWVRTNVDGKDLLLSVKDQGVGLSAEMKDEIFEPFIQAESSLAREIGGLGIGLALAKHIVDLHGGSIEVQSDGPGRGSEFSIRLPQVVAGLRNERLTTNKEPLGLTTIANSPASILLVEDSRDVAILMRFMLTKLGYQVKILENWELVLPVLEQDKIDIVLLDIGLPEVSGYEIAQMIRADDRFADLPLVALSGYATEEHRKMAYSAGFNRHLTKPVSAEQLGQHLRALLEGASVEVR